MADIEVSGEAATVENTEAAREAAVSSQEQGGSERDWDADARDMGWVPEAEFKGAKRPSKFLSAQEFVERGETYIPFLKNRIERQEKDFSDRLSKMEKAHNKTVEKIEAQHQRELEGLQAKREEALDKGDAATVRKLDKEIKAHEKDAPDAKQEADPQAVEADWAKDNDWYRTNKVMRGFAIAHSQEIAEPGLSMTENLRLTAEAVRKEFPLYFSKAGANGHAPVEGGGSGGRSVAKDPLASLPKEAQDQAKRDMQAYPKIYPNAKAWAEAYNS